MDGSCVHAWLGSVIMRERETDFFSWGQDQWRMRCATRDREVEQPQDQLHSLCSFRSKRCASSPENLLQCVGWFLGDEVLD